jgi:hypothetical protein
MSVWSVLPWISLVVFAALVKLLAPPVVWVYPHPPVGYAGAAGRDLPIAGLLGVAVVIAAAVCVLLQAWLSGV